MSREYQIKLARLSDLRCIRLLETFIPTFETFKQNIDCRRLDHYERIKITDPKAIRILWKRHVATWLKEHKQNVRPIKQENDAEYGLVDLLTTSINLPMEYHLVLEHYLYAMYEPSMSMQEKYQYIVEGYQSYFNKDVSAKISDEFMQKFSQLATHFESVTIRYVKENDESWRSYGHILDNEKPSFHEFKQRGIDIWFHSMEEVCLKDEQALSIVWQSGVNTLLKKAKKHSQKIKHEDEQGYTFIDLLSQSLDLPMEYHYVIENYVFAYYQPSMSVAQVRQYLDEGYRDYFNQELHFSDELIEKLQALLNQMYQLNQGNRKLSLYFDQIKFHSEIRHSILPVSI